MVFYKDRALLAGKYGVAFGARVMSEDVSVQDIVHALQEQDMFGEQLSFDIEKDFVECTDNEMLMDILKSTSHAIWWYSSKKPNIAGITWLEAAQQKPSFNIFDFVDLVVARNKKDAWLYYQHHLIHQELAEVIPSVLWGFKSLFNVIIGEAEGMSPFVINKMKKQSIKWTPEEVVKKQAEMIEIYEGEIEGKNSARMFEQFLLTL
ncbi:MAG TPA: hypothetical protein VGE63_03360 [Candidatus Paceibacterota bacterium]